MKWDMKKFINLVDVKTLTIGHSNDFTLLKWTDNQKRQSLAITTKGGKTLAVIVEEDEHVFDAWIAVLAKLLPPETEVVETEYFSLDTHHDL
eukprot:1330471-Amorphochlora_amoeboformis.AAC.1